jgi:sterol desaturase/sphingolipid hydroxylase (fatty acid hydroxylase superfamily)
VPLTVIAYTLYHKNPHHRFSLKRFLRFVFPKRILLHRSSLLDYRFFAINVFVFATISAVITAALKWVFPWTTQALTSLFGPSGLQPTQIPRLIIVLYAVVSFCVMDLVFYWVHYAFHRVPWLWEFHKVHHSPEILNPMTAYRAHPFNGIWILSLQVTFFDITAGVFNYFYPGIIDKSLVLGTNGLTILSHALGGYLRHSNVWLHFGRRLNHVISAPAHHHIHHSNAQEHWDTNYAGLLSLWDWIFGTLVLPGKRQKIKFGLGAESADYTTVPQLYFTPFVKVWANHLKPQLVRVFLASKAKATE